MIIPIRCFSCGKPIAQNWEKYKDGIAKGADPKKVLDKLGYDRYCCRRMFITQTDIIDEVMQYKKF